MYLSRMRLDAVNCVRICWPERVGAFVVHFFVVSTHSVHL